jgi:hypothetical protein
MTNPTNKTDGEKSAAMRHALQQSLDALPDTAHEPRKTIRDAIALPSIVLAVVYDHIKAEG